MNQYSAAAAQTQRPGINISVMAAPCWQTCETATSSALIIVKQRAKKNEGQLSTASTTRSAWFGSLGSKRPKAKQPIGQTIPYTQTGNGMLRAKSDLSLLRKKSCFLQNEMVILLGITYITILIVLQVC